MKTNDSINDKKNEILDKIFIKEEDTLKDLEEIVNKCLEHFVIDANSEKIIFKNHIQTIPDKINLLLIGQYLMKNKGLISSEGINLSEISKRLSIKTTSLSKSIGILLNKKYQIKKDDKGNYSIQHYKIKEILDEAGKWKKKLDQN